MLLEDKSIFLHIIAIGIFSKNVTKAVVLTMIEAEIAAGIDVEFDTNPFV